MNADRVTVAFVALDNAGAIVPLHGWERATPVALMGCEIHKDEPRSGALPAKTKRPAGPWSEDSLSPLNVEED